MLAICVASIVTYQMKPNQYVNKLNNRLIGEIKYAMD